MICFIEALLFFFLSLWLWRLWNSSCCRTKSFPPGPFAWPILGHLHLFSDLPHQTLAKLSSKYGPLLGLRLGLQPCVVISSPALAKDILFTHDHVFANRPPYHCVSLLSYGAVNDLFFNAYGPQWRKHRKICTLELFTAKRLQELKYVQDEEIAMLVQKIRDASQGGTKAVDIGTCVGAMSSNVVMRLLRSRVIGQGEFEDLQVLMKTMEHETGPMVGDLIPWLKWVDVIRERRMRCVHDRADKILETILEEREQSMQGGKQVFYDDLVQALISKEVKNITSPHEDALTKDEIKGIMLGIIAGALLTTALTIEWAMAELLRNPHCLAKLQTEIDTIIGKHKQIMDSDTSQLSYLKCVVKEIFRLHPVVPLLLPRISSQECTVNKYVLPAKTHVLVNVWAIGRDEQVWKNAEQFIPERFQDKDIDLKGQHFGLLPFGSGRRVCLGLPLGLSIVQVTLANLVSKFEWDLPVGETRATMSMTEKRGITSSKATPMLAIPKWRV